MQSAVHTQSASIFVFPGFSASNEPAWFDTVESFGLGGGGEEGLEQ